MFGLGFICGAAFTGAIAAAVLIKDIRDRDDAHARVCPTHVGMNRPGGQVDTPGQIVCPTHVGMNRDASLSISLHCKSAPRTWG